MARTKKIPVASGPIRNPAYVGPLTTNLPHLPISSTGTPIYPPGLSADPTQPPLTYFSGSSIATPLGPSDIRTAYKIPSTFDPAYPPGPLAVDPTYPRGPLAFNSAYSSASSAVDLSYPGFSAVDPAYRPSTAQIAYPLGQSTVEQSHIFSGPHLAPSSSIESSDFTVPSALPYNQHNNSLTIARNQFYNTLAAGAPQTNTPQRNTQILTATSGFSTNNNGLMDKRHPSSFQQLEKLGEGTYATVSLAHSSKIVLIFLGFQRAESTNRGACSAQGNPPRFRGRHPFHCYTRDIIDERAQA